MLRNYIEGVPHHHSRIEGHYLGQTEKGLNFDIEVETSRLPLTSNGYARRMMELRIQASEEARQRGVGLGVCAPVVPEAPEERTSIMLRIAAPGKVYKIPVTVNLDGSYSANSFSRNRSLREIVRETATLVEARHGFGGVLPAASRHG